MITHYFFKKPYRHGADALIGGYVAYTQHATEDRNLTFDEYKAAYPGEYSEPMTPDDFFSFLASHEEHTYLKPVGTIIDRERFDDALNCLPPCRWKTHRGIEFFYVSEAYTSNIHSYYCNDGTTFVTFLGRSNMPVDDICDKFRQAVDAHAEEVST